MTTKHITINITNFNNSVSAIENSPSQFSPQLICDDVYVEFYDTQKTQGWLTYNNQIFVFENNHIELENIVFTDSICYLKTHDLIKLKTPFFINDKHNLKIYLLSMINLSKLF